MRVSSEIERVWSSRHGPISHWHGS